MRKIDIFIWSWKVMVSFHLYDNNTQNPNISWIMLPFLGGCDNPICPITLLLVDLVCQFFLQLRRLPCLNVLLRLSGIGVLFLWYIFNLYYNILYHINVWVHVVNGLVFTRSNKYNF